MRRFLESSGTTDRDHRRLFEVAAAFLRDGQRCSKAAPERVPSFRRSAQTIGRCGVPARLARGRHPAAAPFTQHVVTGSSRRAWLTPRG